MDKREMKRRLDAGEEPIDVAIAKWRDLKKRWVNLSGKEHFRTCALCVVYAVGKTKPCGNCPLVKMAGGMKCDTRGSPFRVALDTKTTIGMLRALCRAKQYVKAQKPIEAKKKREAAKKRKIAAAKKKAAKPKVGDKVSIKLKSGDYFYGRPEQRYLESQRYTITEVESRPNSDGTYGCHLKLEPICFAYVKLSK